MWKNKKLITIYVSILFFESVSSLERGIHTKNRTIWNAPLNNTADCMGHKKKKKKFTVSTDEIMTSDYMDKIIFEPAFTDITDGITFVVRRKRRNAINALRFTWNTIHVPTRVFKTCGKLQNAR